MDTGLSGGDVHALRLCDRMARGGARRLRLVAPPSFADRIPASVRPYVLPVRTPLDGHVRSLPAYLAAVIWRMLVALRVTPRARVAVASTHFFFDVVPVAMMRIRYGSRVAAYVYHLVLESDRPAGLATWASAALERASLGILRRTGDVIFVDNDETRRALLSRGFGPGQLAMTQNAYDPLQPLPPRLRPDRPSVVFIGRLVDVKGVWEVLDLARGLREKLPAARVSLIGDGPLRSDLEQALVREAGLNVELAGFVSDAEKWRRLRAASLFVAPSREEGWGIAVGEALTAGVPAVVYDLPAYSHFGDLVFRVPAGDPRGFIGTAVDLLCEPSRLEDARRRIEDRGAELPRWDAVLANEIAELDRGAPSPGLGVSDSQSGRL
jgi:glycosyltransferase involved in cell wall biosynthesis